MATDSIFHNFVIRNDDEALALIEALEAAEKAAEERKERYKNFKFSRPVVEATPEMIRRVLERIEEKND